MVVAVAALAGAAIGWRFPFVGQRRTSNQLETAQQPTSTRSTNRAQTLRANQPAAQAQNNNQTTAQAPNDTVSPEAPGTTEPAQQTPNEPVPALW